MIDLSERPATQRHSVPWPDLARARWVLAAVAAGIVAAAGLTVVVARSAPGDPAHAIALEWAGDGSVDYAAVWPRGGHPMRPASILAGERLADAPPAGDRYADPMAALIVVRAGADGQATCRVTVDGQVVDEQTAASGLAVTCSWSAR